MWGKEEWGVCLGGWIAGGPSRADGARDGLGGEGPETPKGGDRYIVSRRSSSTYRTALRPPPLDDLCSSFLRTHASCFHLLIAPQRRTLGRPSQSPIMSFFPSNNTYKPQVRQEGFHLPSPPPSNPSPPPSATSPNGHAFDPNSMFSIGTHFINDPFRKSANDPNMDFGDELASLMAHSPAPNHGHHQSHERSTHSPDAPEHHVNGSGGLRQPRLPTQHLRHLRAQLAPPQPQQRRLLAALADAPPPRPAFARAPVLLPRPVFPNIQRGR